MRLPWASPLLIVVDWSSLSADMCWHWLRASVVVEGRSITLYEEVHPRSHLAAYTVHKRFLERLDCVLPAQQSAPIVLTDAGFRGTWFALVRAQGWDWVGRIRNREYVCSVTADQQAVADKKSSCWIPAKTLYAGANATSEDLGLFDSTRNKPTAVVWCASSACQQEENIVTPAARNNATHNRRRSLLPPVSRGCCRVRQGWRT